MKEYSTGHRYSSQHPSAKHKGKPLRNATVTGSRVTACLLALMLLLTACGGSKALTEYHENMTAFFEEVAVCHQNIGVIDPAADDAPEKLLHYLDMMNGSFQTMKDYPIPDEFLSIKNLTADAAASMQSATDYYHQAYDGDFDAESADTAKQYYDRAQKCIEVMGKVLRGEDPSGDGVKVTY